VIGRRLDHLSAECNRVLTTAAVVGREFGLDALERLTDLSADCLLEALEEAVAARVVAEVPRAVGRYAFSHALIRETLYEELTTSRRARFHRQVGEVLEALYAGNPEPHVAELAYHFFEAGQTGDIDKAIGYAIRAGNRAAASAGHEEAARHYEKALQALELTETRDEERRGELLLTLGDFLWRAGLFNRAKEVFLQAAEIARTLGAPEQLARAALGFGGRFSGFGAGRFDRRLVDLLEEALAALGEAHGGLRAVVMARLAEALTFSPARERRVALSRQAVEIARRNGDPAELAYVLRSTHWALWGPDNLEERLAVATEMVQLADVSGDRATAAEGRFWQFSNLLETGDVAAARQAFEAAARLAEQTRQPYLQWATETFRTMLALLEGRFEEGEQLAEQALKIALRTQNQDAVMLFGGQMVSIRREQGRVQELDVGLQSLVDQYPLLPVFRCLLPWICAEMGRQADARKEFEAIAAHDFAALPRDFQWIAELVLLADACAYLGDANRAAKLYGLLLPYAARCAVYGVASVCTGSLHRTLGLLAGTMSHWEEATRHFEAALEVNTRIGTRPWVAHTQHDYARTLLARGHPGDREKALGLLGRALDTADALGMKGLVSKALALKLRAQGIEPGAFPASIDAVATAVQSERPDLRRHAAPDGTVTILFSDIEGSSAMTERLGDRRWLELLRIHNAMIRRELAVRHGYEVKTQGDGFMVAFSSARRALFCAIAIQRAFAAYNESQPEEVMRVRIGLHTGEAIKDTDDFFGKNVILAARIAAEAAGGEILVSSLVKQLTDSAGDIPFKGEREVVLKGLSGTHGVFAVGWS